MDNFNSDNGMQQQQKNGYAIYGLQQMNRAH